MRAVSIPSSVTSIGHRAYCHCSGLTSVSIPSSVTSIGDYSFAYCSKLIAVQVPRAAKYVSQGSLRSFNATCRVTWY